MITKTKTKKNRRRHRRLTGGGNISLSLPSDDVYEPSAKRLKTTYYKENTHGIPHKFHKQKYSQYSHDIDEPLGVITYSKPTLYITKQPREKSVEDFQLGDEYGIYDEEFYGGRKRRRTRTQRRRRWGGVL